MNGNLEDLTAADVMSTDLITISPDDAVWTAWTRMSQHRVRHLLVLDGSRCVGVLDDRRLLLDWPVGPIATLNRRVREVIPYRTRCVLADAPVQQVAWVMHQHRVDSVPVIDETGKPLGLVTVTDLVAVIAGAGTRYRAHAG